MARPLRSTPITGASPLLRAGPPAHLATVLTALRHYRLTGSLSPTQGVGCIKARLPTFRTRPADRAPAACMPDTDWPIPGHPPASSPGPFTTQGSDVTLRNNDTSTAVRFHSASRSPPDASRTPFPHRSPQRSSANAACGGLRPPPEGRSRRAKPPSLVQHRLRYSLTTHKGPFVGRGTMNVCVTTADKRRPRMDRPGCISLDLTQFRRSRSPRR